MTGHYGGNYHHTGHLSENPFFLSGRLQYTDHTASRKKLDNPWLYTAQNSVSSAQN